MSHPLLGAVERTLPAGARRDAYLSLLARRLEALKDVAEEGMARIARMRPRRQAQTWGET